MTTHVLKTGAGDMLLDLPMRCAICGEMITAEDFNRGLIFATGDRPAEGSPLVAYEAGHVRHLYKDGKQTLDYNENMQRYAAAVSIRLKGGTDA
jgi:hypothetical protein